MEIIVVLVFLSILIGLTILKTKMSLKLRLIFSVFFGIPLIAWVWFDKQPLIYWKIIITIVVVSSIFKYLMALKHGADNLKTS